MEIQISHQYYYSLLFLCVTALTAPPSYADIILRLDSGSAELSDQRYDSAYSTRITGGYDFGSVSVMVSDYDFDGFTLNNNRNAQYELNGSSVEAFWTVSVGRVEVDLGGGIFNWESEIKLDGRIFGRDSGSSGILEAGARMSLGPLVGIYLNAQLVEDLSGEDLTVLSGGVQFTF